MVLLSAVPVFTANFTMTKTALIPVLIVWFLEHVLYAGNSFEKGKLGLDHVTWVMGILGDEHKKKKKGTAADIQPEIMQHIQERNSF